MCVCFEKESWLSLIHISEVRELAQEQLEMRFPSRQEQEDFEDDSEFFLDEDDITE